MPLCFLLQQGTGLVFQTDRAGDRSRKVYRRIGTRALDQKRQSAAHCLMSDWAQGDWALDVSSRVMLGPTDFSPGANPKMRPVTDAHRN